MGSLKTIEFYSALQGHQFYSRLRLLPFQVARKMCQFHSPNVRQPRLKRLVWPRHCLWKRILDQSRVEILQRKIKTKNDGESVGLNRRNLQI